MSSTLWAAIVRPRLSPISSTRPLPRRCQRRNSYRTPRFRRSRSTPGPERSASAQGRATITISRASAGPEASGPRPNRGIDPWREEPTVEELPNRLRAGEFVVPDDVADDVAYPPAGAQRGLFPLLRGEPTQKLDGVPAFETGQIHCCHHYPTSQRSAHQNRPECAEFDSTIRRNHAIDCCEFTRATLREFSKYSRHRKTRY